MAESDALFATRLYRTTLESAFNAELEKAVLALAAQDAPGIQWCRENGYLGYTSFASIHDLPRRAPVFAELVRRLDGHVGEFCRAEFDMGPRRLILDGIWVNVMEQGAFHAPHLHRYCVVSGTYYVSAPQGSGAIVFEDPRLPLMMAAPPRKAGNGLEGQTFAAIQPQPGLLLLWESWLRHGVDPNKSQSPRISISFNYRMG